MLLDLYSGSGWGQGRETRYRLPDDVIVVATTEEAEAIIRAMEEEYTERKPFTPVPVIAKETRKSKYRPKPTPADFPAAKPIIQQLRAIRVPKKEIDFATGLRAYMEGASTRLRQRDEDEWLILSDH